MINNVDLYEFLKENTENKIWYNEKDNGLNACMLINFEWLEEFRDIIKSGYFDDGGREVTMMNGYIAIDLLDVLEYFGEDLKDYRRIFDKDDWNTFEVEINKYCER